MAELHDLILFIYRQAQEQDVPDFQDAVLRAVQRCLPFDSAKWGVSQVSPQKVVFLSPHIFGEDGRAAEVYAEVAEQDSVGKAAAASSGIAMNFNARAEYSSRAQKGILDYALRFRHENGLIVAEVDSHGKGRSVSLYRRLADRQFSPCEQATGQVLALHMMEALAINHRLALSHSQIAESGLRNPTAIVGRTGLILYAEPAFMQLLRAEWPDADGTFLPAALATALLQRRCLVFAGRVAVIGCLRAGDPTFLRARKRLPVDSLSTRELAVAKRIASGESYKEIAKALSLSPATVRNHIASIHERLGAHTNAELAAHVSSGFI